MSACKNASRTKRREAVAAMIADMPNHRIAGRRNQALTNALKRIAAKRAGK